MKKLVIWMVEIMIRADGDISECILEKVNHNIYLILELFTESCKGLDYETFLVEIFPKHFVRKNMHRCIEIIDELTEYSRDLYLHELTPVQEYALFYLFEWWLEVTDVEFDEVVSEKEIKTDDDEYIAMYINDIEKYKGFMFYDWDFLDEFLSEYIEAYKSYGPLANQLLHIDLDDYIDLMPDDKKKEYNTAREKYRLYNKEQDQDFKNEQLIIKQIYNALKAREKYPKRLQETSETELSDDIADIVRENLQENGIIITREMPSGFAKKSIGECDFYIYTYIDGVFKAIAIGENKEWGNFENQLKQLIGYMTKDTQFGFTILFNKSVQANTALTKRKRILEDFYVEINGNKLFVVEGIWESKVMKDVLITKHENPEKRGAYFRVYHFIINSYLRERESSAKDARSVSS